MSRRAAFQTGWTPILVKPIDSHASALEDSYRQRQLESDNQQQSQLDSFQLKQFDSNRQQEQLVQLFKSSNPQLDSPESGMVTMKL